MPRVFLPFAIVIILHPTVTTYPETSIKTSLLKYWLPSVINSASLAEDPLFFSNLYLRGGVGPHARLLPEADDIRVHYPVRGMPMPDHYCVKSALHRSRRADWDGRRIFVSEAMKNNGEGDALGRRFERYTWDSTIRIGTMKYGSGNASVMRIAGDDNVQLWGKWHFEGKALGVFQGLYAMYMDYGPYKPLIVVSKGADVLFEQCEIRNFGGKCIVMQYFAEVTLDWCTVGGSIGSRAPEHHKKLQVWFRDDLMPLVVRRHSIRIERARTPKQAALLSKGIDLRKEWAPAGSSRASDGVSVESGSWLICHRVCFEDTGRAHGVAVRAIGHARVNLDTCRFQRNGINLAADATAHLTLDNCHEFLIDPGRAGQQGYRGEKNNFHAHRALQLPGNGTSTLEAQAPTEGPHLEWRIPGPTNRNWQLNDRPFDPNRQRKRIEQHAERKAIRARIRLLHPGSRADGARRAAAAGAPRKKIYASHRDFTPFTTPTTALEKRIERDPRRRYLRDRSALSAPESLTGPLPAVYMADPVTGEPGRVVPPRAGAAAAEGRKGPRSVLRRHKLAPRAAGGGGRGAGGGRGEGGGG